MRGPFGTARPLSLAALDAAISETIGRPVRADRLARDDCVYRWICRRAIGEGSLRFNTTYAEAAKGAGYAVPRLTSRANRRQARRQRVSTIYRALSSLQSAGLVRFHAVKRPDGRDRCLSVGLTPAGYGAPIFGRSARAPRRGPHGRVSFSRRSGTPPEVETSKNRLESGDVRGRAREGPTERHVESGSGFLAAALAPLEANSHPQGPHPWPHERFDLSDPEVVTLVELFEEAFGIPAKFSYRKHGPVLRRLLDRFDCFGPREVGSLGPGRTLITRHPGFFAAATLIRQRGALYRTGNLRLQKVRSLAYLLPVLDQKSRTARRNWKKRHGFTTWGPTEEG